MDRRVHLSSTFADGNGPLATPCSRWTPPWTVWQYLFASLTYCPREGCRGSPLSHGALAWTAGPQGVL
eukprot:1826833-Pyramimonas_sp.AAC.1